MTQLQSHRDVTPIDQPLDKLEDLHPEEMSVLFFNFLVHEC